MQKRIISNIVIVAFAIQALLGTTYAQSLTPSATETTSEIEDISPANDSFVIGPVPIRPENQFHWRAATTDSFKFLLLQTVARIAFQQKTRDGLSGPFLKGYVKTLKTKPIGFMDGDSFLTNFVGHPIQGATSYHIARNRGASTHQAFWWGVAYSTHFELGLLGEAGIGKVRLSPVDLVVTPSAGLALGMTEEWLWDKLEEIDNRFAKVLRFVVVGKKLSRLVSR